MLRIICDLDATIIDTKERMSKIERKYGIDNWPIEAVEEFVEPKKIASDKLIEDGIDIIFKLIEKYNAVLYFSTGRSEIARKCTLDFLNNKLIKIINKIGKIPNDKLFMRSNSSPHMKPEEIKENNFLILQTYFNNKDILLFFDDDPSCVKMYSKYGLSFKATECWNYLEIQ